MDSESARDFGWTVTINESLDDLHAGSAIDWQQMKP